MSDESTRSAAPAASVRLDSAQFVRTEFLDRVAHELRGPAGVTLGALDELELALADAAEAHRPLLAMARRGALKVLRTADRLTRTAQLEAGVTFVPVLTDLRALVRAACADASRVEERHKVTLALRLPDAPCCLPLDAGWVQAAITELVAQALHRARREVCVELLDPRTLLITNDGTGHLAAPATQRFEPLADRRDAGLAMPLAREVAHAHGGDFNMETSPTGMRVTIAFGAAR